MWYMYPYKEYYSEIRNELLIYAAMWVTFKSLCSIKEARPKKGCMLYDSVYVTFLGRKSENIETKSVSLVVQAVDVTGN